MRNDKTKSRFDQKYSKNIRLYLKNYNFEKTLGFAFDYNNLTNQLEVFH
uniref:Uncharacterized protein n=1 Tax=Candidatus Phytoplasma australasiaticum subsp. australasiaticum TaxID=2832407 RepID=A0A7S7FZD5_9MOLU|nr:hypothetical protein H7685_01955 ['Parthenium hysterophorus' phyllody phytoplasma]